MQNSKPISRKQNALLWVAKSKLGLSEAEFRAAMAQIAGVSSTKELDVPGFEAMMGFFEYLGFTPLTAKGKNYGSRAGMASFAQIELIRNLWLEYTGNRSDEAGLNKWLESKWKVSSLRFVTKSKAQRIITALKAMKARQAA
ncbi:regulatory protein GemA [Profundibacter sp.]